MRAIEADPTLDLLILLGDQHGSELFGSTADEVRRDFPNAAIELIEMGTGSGDTDVIRGESLATCLRAAVETLGRERPDIVLVHGDRAEHLVVALAALTLGLTVAHTQGGDRSGNVDEIQRHAISKLAHLHFPETTAAAERLTKMGEDRWRIHTVGSTYIDRIVAGAYTSAAEARAGVGLNADEPFLLALVHPETNRDRAGNRALAQSVLTAIRSDGRRTVVTYPCSDPGYRGILAAIDEIANDPQFIVRSNIDNGEYLGLMSAADLLVGNSSAALVEAPYFHLPAVNVGIRQEGRARDPNVIDAEASPAAVAAAIAIAADPALRTRMTGAQLRLGDGHAGERIVEILREVVLDQRLLQKQISY